MSTYLKQSTAIEIAVGPFLDDTDGKTAETALTITQPDIRLKKNGGAWAQKNAAQTLSHEENGWYEVALDATDTGTLGTLVVAIHESGALPVWREFVVLAANVFDSLIGGGDLLDVSTTQWAGTVIPAPAVTGVPKVDVTHSTGVAQATIATQASVDAIGTAVDTEVAAILAAVDTEVAAIKAKTDNLPASPAAVGSAMTLALDAVNASALAADAVTEIRTGLGLAAGNLDTQLSAISAFIDTEVAAILAAVDTEVAAIKAKTDNLPAAPAAVSDIPTAAVNAAALLDLASGVETGMTPRQALRLMASVLGGKVSGAGTGTEVFRNAVADVKARVTATVDSSGNRTAITTDLT